MTTPPMVEKLELDGRRASNVDINSNSLALNGQHSTHCHCTYLASRPSVYSVHIPIG